MEGEGHPLTLEEVLDETNQLDVGNKTKLWLQTDALKNNPKVSASPEGTYSYKVRCLFCARISFASVST